MTFLQNHRQNLHESGVSLDSWDGHTANYMINDALKCPSFRTLPICFICGIKNT